MLLYIYIRNILILYAVCRKGDFNFILAIFLESRRTDGVVLYDI